ncbi:zinc finger protein [Carcharodon carcharias]|uniref:zinc finger protein n=1 Tax=Carcharodon carcharias TaxID=13397 RepID=UPI001B7EB63D|nr:zinc finger protein [Carcharodon carcharias]
MKSAGTGETELFTDSYCNICNAQLISESQRVAHYESKKHANKVRLYYMLHPEDGGPPSKKLRPDNPDSDDGEVDKNKCCTLCNMFFTSAIVAQSHYQGKTHAKRMRLVLGEPPIPPRTTESPPDVLQPAAPIFSGLGPITDNGDSGKFCQLCSAWFNNPMMAQQHYEGKKHKKNAARAKLLEQLGETLDSEALRALKSSYTCNICNVILNSVEQFHAHLQGSKHQSKARYKAVRPIVLQMVHLSPLEVLLEEKVCRQLQKHQRLSSVPQRKSLGSLWERNYELVNIASSTSTKKTTRLTGYSTRCCIEDLTV